jgi:hypothetical protein
MDNFKIRGGGAANIFNNKGGTMSIKIERTTKNIPYVQ